MDEEADISRPTIESGAPSESRAARLPGIPSGDDRAQVARDVNRVLSVMTAASQAVIRATEETALLRQICRIVVEVGGHRLCWVAGHVQSGLVEPLACQGRVGAGGEALARSLAGADGEGPVLAAIRSGRTQILDDLAADPAPWAADARNLGLMSMMALPLRDEGDVFGCLVAAAARRAAFDATEAELLTGLAQGMSYGIANLRRRKAQEAFRHKLEHSLEATVGAVGSLAEMRDPYTAGHQRRVARLATAIAREMGLPAETIRGIGIAALIHDIGKMRVPTEILNRPGQLSPVEIEFLKLHADAGYEILRGIDFPWPVPEMVRQHHEKMDGSGYPQGLAGSEILIGARVLTVADVVEAMASHRPYREGLGLDRALAEIAQGRGSLYDPQAVDACLALFRRGYAIDEGESGQAQT